MSFNFIAAIAICSDSEAQKNRSGAAAERAYPMPEVRGSGREELPCIWGKEQRLRFAGAAVKRDLMSNVRETQVRW